VAGALDLILAQLDKRIAELKRQLLANVAAGLSSDKNPEIAKMEAGITESIHIAVSVCQRHTERSRAGTEKDSEQLWFKLLDALVVPLRKLRAKQNRRAVATPVPTRPHTPCTTHWLMANAQLCVCVRVRSWVAMTSKQWPKEELHWHCRTSRCRPRFSRSRTS